MEGEQQEEFMGGRRPVSNKRNVKKPAKAVKKVPVKPAIRRRRVGGNDDAQHETSTESHDSQDSAVVQGGARRPAPKRRSRGGQEDAHEQQGGKRKPSAYNLFVKKHLSSMKKANPKMSAADCMKAVAAKWKKEKK